MTRQVLTSIKIDIETSEKLGFLAVTEHRTKLDEIRFLVEERELTLKQNGKKIVGGSKKK